MAVNAVVFHAESLLSSSSTPEDEERAENALSRLVARLRTARVLLAVVRTSAAGRLSPSLCAF